MSSVRRYNDKEKEKNTEELSDSIENIESDVSEIRYILSQIYLHFRLIKDYNDEMKIEVDKFNEVITKLNENEKKFQNEIKDLNHTLNGYQEKEKAYYEEMKLEMEKLNRVIENLNDDVKKYQNQIKDLNKKLQDMKEKENMQYKKQRDFEHTSRKPQQFENPFLCNFIPQNSGAPASVNEHSRSENQSSRNFSSNKGINQTRMTTPNQGARPVNSQHSFSNGTISNPRNTKYASQTSNQPKDNALEIFYKKNPHYSEGQSVSQINPFKV